MIITYLGKDVPDLNLAGSKIQHMTVWHLIAQSLAFSPFLQLKSYLLFKGCKTTNYLKICWVSKEIFFPHLCRNICSGYSLEKIQERHFSIC